MKVLDISCNHQSVPSTEEMFGIEIEVENVRVPNCTGTIWNVIEDGSLRNSGFEFVSRPCNYDEAVAGVRRFYEWSAEHRYRTSIRTSTHVHYSVLSWELEELVAALTAYSIVEPLLFRICGKEREENIYCVPWYRAANDTFVLREMLDNKIRVEMACKYSALYLEPLVRFGTVEFRQAPVFPDADTLMFWIDMVRALMRQGRVLGTGESVMTRLDDLGTDRFVELMFGRELTEKLVTYCEQSFESIIEGVDAISVAESCVPSLYTYKVTDEWGTTDVAEGNSREGYHSTARARHPMYDLDQPDDYPDSEEYHEEVW